MCLHLSWMLGVVGHQQRWKGLARLLRCPRRLAVEQTWTDAHVLASCSAQLAAKQDLHNLQII